MLTTGPNSKVMGDATRPSAGTLVSVRRLRPVGWNRSVEKRRLCPCARAYADHSRYQTLRPASVQAQVITEEGRVVHVCHHTTSDTTR